METIWDVIIVGGGPAGLTSGIYTARHSLKTLILDGQKIGGRAHEAHWIENYPGFPEGIEGHKLVELFHQQALRFGVQFHRETVIGITDIGNMKMVSTRGGYYKTKSIIIATGARRNQLSVPGENEFKGKGVSYCAICDGPFYKDKVVAVVGSGHEAVEDALNLAEIATKVYAIPGSKSYSETNLLEKIKQNPKIQLLDGCEVAEIKGRDSVDSILLKGCSIDEVKTDGVFILLEQVSNDNVLGDVGVILDKVGCIVVDRNQQTSIPGVFAAGDCCCSGSQIVTAAGEGGKAALSVLRFIRSVN